MTAAPSPEGSTTEMTETAAPPAPMRIAVPETDDSDDHVTFQLEAKGEPIGLPMLAHKPKMGVLLDIAQRMEAASEDAAMIPLVDRFIDSCLEPESAAYFRAETRDPDSPLDLHMLEPVIEALMGKWYKRPTGRRGGSPASPSRTGRRSTVRRPGKA